MNIEVKRDVLIPTPARHICHWGNNVSYTRREGSGMIMTVVLRDGTKSENWKKRPSVLQRWVSEDNGKHWIPYGPEIKGGSYDAPNARYSWHHFLDPYKDLLLSVFQKKRTSSDGHKISTLYYEISRDGGKTWGPAKQIIHQGGNSDEVHWMPGVTDNGQYIGVDQAPFVKLDDGTIVFGFTVHPHKRKFPDEQIFVGVTFLRGTWNDDLSEISWEAGDMIQAPQHIAPVGLCEPDLLHLGGQRLLTTMRCQGYEKVNIYSTRQWSISEDGGRTWSKPQLLRYDDGSMVCVPASIAAFEKDPKTGKVYWFANILDKPVFGQVPRYPLTIAEFDPERICIIKDSVSAIQDRPEGAPVDLVYSNFGHYVDRENNEFVLSSMEKKYEKECTADCIRFRIKIRN